MRIGHRPKRDKRITTHVGLVARTFGATGFILAKNDKKVIDNIKTVDEKWGRADFKADITTNPKKYVKDWKKKGGKVVHLTMYGIDLPDFDMKKLKKDNLLVIVGAEKVEPWYYQNADYNIAIGNQPHSEVAALALFLDRYNVGKELKKSYDDAKLRIIPMDRGKRVEFIPNKDECLDLLKGAGADEKLIKHSIKVADLSLKLSEGLDVNKGIIYAGAMLHDIGRTLVNDAGHAYFGSDLLKKKGIDSRVIKVIQNHIGGGITKDDVEKLNLGIPISDYMPSTPEEIIVSEANNRISGTKLVSVDSKVSKYQKKGLNEAASRIIEIDKRFKSLKNSKKDK